MRNPDVLWSYMVGPMVAPYKYKFVELLIPTLNKFISYQFLLILLEEANHKQSSQNN